MSQLSPILARLSAVLGPHGEAEPLDGGITNRNFRVAFGEDEYVVRLPGKDTDLLGIDRGAEWVATRTASKLGIGAPVGAMLDQPRCLVTRFVEGHAMEPAELREPAVIREVAGALRAFHGSGADLPVRFSAFRLVETYEKIARDRGIKPPKAYSDARKRARAIESALRGPSHSPVPCHNDLLPGNFIRCVSGVKLIDWEYAGMGDRYFDLGNLAVNNGFEDGEEVTLLDAYFGQPPGAGQRAALRLMRFMSDFREAMWGVVQGAISQLDFDFEDYAARHFDRLEQLGAHKDFGRWVKAARAS